jgi:hypothetical protein
VSSLPDRNDDEQSDPQRIAVRVPATGNSASVLTVSLWLVEIGEWVEAGDRVVELLIPGNAGARVRPGDVLGWLKSRGDDSNAP